LVDSGLASGLDTVLLPLDLGLDRSGLANMHRYET
jgi:hypothetical protein